MTDRRSRDRRKCTFHIQEDSSKWIARDRAYILLIILSVGVHGRSGGLRQGVQLVRQHDVRHRSPDLVWHLFHLHPVLRRHESSRNRSQDAAICVSPSAFCGVVCSRLVPCYLLRACFVVIHLELHIDQKTTTIGLHSSAAGRSSSAGTGTLPPLSQVTCPLRCSRYCTLARSYGSEHQLCDRQRWISTPDSRRSRQILMMSRRLETRWRRSGSGW